MNKSLLKLFDVNSMSAIYPKIEKFFIIILLEKFQEFAPNLLNISYKKVPQFS